MSTVVGAAAAAFVAHGVVVAGLDESAAAGTEIAAIVAMVASPVALIAAVVLGRAITAEVRRSAARESESTRILNEQRRRAEHLATGQAGVLELIASGTSPSGVQQAIGALVSDETGGAWTVSSTGLTRVDQSAEHPGQDLEVIVDRLLSVTRERDRITSALTHQATHDGLTGLANRAAVLERIGHAMRQRRKEPDVAVVYLDLDRFKQVNDSLGHEVGDELLKVVAQRITDSVREGDTVGRIGGDEFVVVLESINLDQARMVANRMIDRLLAPLEIGGAPIDVGVSMGVAMVELGDRDPDKLLREADLAMYRAKQNGVPMVEADEDLREWSRERHDIEVRLRGALADEDLTMRYQPVVDTDTGELRGVEALVRLMWGDRMLSPGLFLQLAEETGQIAQVDNQVLRAAGRQVVQWQEEYGRPLELAINISGAHLARADVFDEVMASLDHSGLPPEQLVLEITEGVFLSDATEVAKRLDLLRRLGVKVAVDDFGTGYSSLTYLQRLPVDILKIDRAFTNRLGLTKSDDAIVRTILDLADALELDVIAEGVETDGQLAKLRELGCPGSQGYLFAKPSTAEDFAAQWLAPKGIEAA
ncbi:MAG: EAL domain-containing protein [Actinomycetota bacterium]